MLRRIPLLFVLGTSLAIAQPTLTAPTSAKIGSEVSVTDGEETCGGDPAAAIAGLKKAGAAVRVNIVGFAIDDEKLAATFRHWSDLGSGMYFDAKDASSLNAAMLQAMRPGFEIVNAQGKVVVSGIVGGEAVRVMPGNYAVRLVTQTGKPQPAVVKAKETSSVVLSTDP